MFRSGRLAVDMKELVTQFLERFLFFPFSTSVLRLQHFLAVFDDLATLQNLGMFRSGRLAVDMKELVTQFLQSLYLTRRIYFKIGFGQNFRHVADLIANDIAGHSLINW